MCISGGSMANDMQRYVFQNNHIAVGMAYHKTSDTTTEIAIRQ